MSKELKECLNNNCKNTFIGNNKKMFCSNICRMNFHNSKCKNIAGKFIKVNHTNLGMISKIKIIEDLLKKGYSLYNSIFTNNNFIVAEKENILFKLAIRTGYYDQSGKFKYRDSTNKEVDFVSVYDPIKDNISYINMKNNNNNL